VRWIYELDREAVIRDTLFAMEFARSGKALADLRQAITDATGKIVVSARHAVGAPASALVVELAW